MLPGRGKRVTKANRHPAKGGGVRASRATRDEERARRTRRWKETSTVLETTASGAEQRWERRQKKGPTITNGWTKNAGHTGDEEKQNAGGHVDESEGGDEKKRERERKCEAERKVFGAGAVETERAVMGSGRALSVNARGKGRVSTGAVGERCLNPEQHRLARSSDRRASRKSRGRRKKKKKVGRPRSEKGDGEGIEAERRIKGVRNRKRWRHDRREKRRKRKKKQSARRRCAARGGLRRYHDGQGVRERERWGQRKTTGRDVGSDRESDGERVSIGERRTHLRPERGGTGSTKERLWR